ncbi:MAG TPA: glycine betaine ABC transporter substrate-binding protein [Streptomyces sp.]|nr:glycine betaine ABC transporter substrate-binding protein [Streptomyces sp.]
MRRIGSAHRRLAALFAVGTLMVTGCSDAAGGQGAHVDAKALHSGSIAENIDLKGAHFTVGSKEFTEQKILGQITLYALRAAGAKTSDQTGLSGSTIVRKALRGGDVDMYWEYAGTGWTQYLGHDKPVQGAKKQFRATARQDAERNDVAWLGPAHFGNQYAIARAGDATGPVGEVDRLSQWRELAKKHPEELSLCGAAEFLDRELRPLQQDYDVDIPPTQVHQNAFALNFVNVAKGSPCNFAEVFTTDARIKSLDLQVLKDDRGHFTTELAGLTVREKTLKKYPELADLAKRIGAKLTEDKMIELNGRVDLEGKSPQEVALHFLRSEGFIGG